MKISIKREQSQAGLSFAERKKFRPKVKRKQLLLLLALLITAATGAWAQSATTHEVTQATVNDIFSGDGYTLGDAVKDGDVLDFQGTIDIDHSLVINKPVTVISATKDAVIKLNSASNMENPVNGDPGRAFVINKAGSGTTVQDIRIENTETWLYNTSNVTFTGVTMWVEEARVGSGVGHVAIRYSDNITFDGCTVYAKNTRGSSACALTGSHDCTFRNSRFEKEGNVGNILYIGNPYNANDKPADYTMNNDNISVINCTLTAERSGGLSYFQIMGGLRHRIENCTVNYTTSISCDATASEDGYVIRNNTFTEGLIFPKYCTAEGNTVTGTASVTINQGATANNNTITVTGNMTISQGATATNNTITVTGTGKVNVNKGSTVTGNTINGNVTINSNSSDGSTITGNAINGTVTFASNSKNNTLTRNVITSTGDYAVVMASTADANNTVQYNTLIAATKKGDEAVNLSNSSGNTISYNSNIALMLADGTKDAANWSATVNGEQPNPLPVGGLSEDDAVTLTYGGRLKVKAVTATFEPDPMLATPLTIEAITPGTIEVNIGGRLESGMKYSVNGNTPTLITTTTSIEGLKAGDKVQFYGNGTQTQAYGVVSIQGIGDGFQTKVYGNIMSLLDETGFATKTDLPNASSVFSGLFRGNATLIDASELLLPATTLTKSCYQQMFDGCTSLTKAPKLPAMTLATSCYAYMFNDCQLLTAAPKLPATTLDLSCYYCMFSGCTSLTTAPKLPATTLATDCYWGMFMGCTSLTSAYVKAAYTEENNMCRDMFDGCKATDAVLHTTSDSKASWEAKMGSGKEWPTWSVAADWQD